MSEATPPFDAERLDGLMEEAGLDVVVATSKHNVRYLLGSYSDFFAHFQAIGVDRVIPTFGYPRGRPQHAFSIASELEAWKQEVEPVWVGEVVNRCQTAHEVADAVGELLDRIGASTGRIGIEASFVPETMHERLAQVAPHATFVDASLVLEALRAVKRPDELAQLRAASEAIVDSMVATVAGARPGTTTRDLTEILRREETNRDLDFEYCLVAVGESFNRAPSNARWERGQILSLDSGGTMHGYLGDLTRMAVFGQPDARMVDALAEVQAIQAAARGVIRAGVPGGEIYRAALEAKDGCAFGDRASFLAHGVGLVSHEAPRLTDSGPIRYPAAHRDRPLEAGMVLSIETDMKIDGLGFVKLEDTVAVTQSGHEGYGDGARDWIVVEP